MHQPLSLTHFTFIIPLHSNANHHLSPLPTTLALHLNTPHLNPPKHTPKDTALLRINSRLARPKASSQKWMGEGAYAPTAPCYVYNLGFGAGAGPLWASHPPIEW